MVVQDSSGYIEGQRYEVRNTTTSVVIQEFVVSLISPVCLSRPAGPLRPRRNAQWPSVRAGASRAAYQAAGFTLSRASRASISASRASR